MCLFFASIVYPSLYKAINVFKRVFKNPLSDISPFCDLIYITELDLISAESTCIHSIANCNNEYGSYVLEMRERLYIEYLHQHCSVHFWRREFIKQKR